MLDYHPHCNVKNTKVSAIKESTDWTRNKVAYHQKHL